MPLTVDEVRQDVSAMLPDGTDLRPLIVVLKHIMRDIRAFKGGGWSFDLAFNTVEVVAAQSAGTVSTTNESTDLVGVGTSFDSPDHTGYKIRLGSVEYIIGSQSSATAAILTTAFAGTDLSGSTYIAYQNSYDLAPRVGKLYRVWDLTNRRELRAEPLIKFETRHHIDQSTGDVLWYSLDTRGSSDEKRIIFRPYPTVIAKILYLFERTHIQITGPGSSVDISEELYETVIQGVYARMLGLLTNHAPASQLEQQTFARMLSDAWRRDQDKGDLKVRFIRQNLALDFTRWRLRRRDQEVPSGI
jgi:hypothetical protein